MATSNTGTNTTNSQNSSRHSSGSVLSVVGWILIIILLIIWAWCWSANRRHKPCWLCGTTAQTFSQEIDLTKVTCLEDETNIRLERKSQATAAALPATSSASMSATIQEILTN